MKLGDFGNGFKIPFLMIKEDENRVIERRKARLAI